MKIGVMNKAQGEEIKRKIIEKFREEGFISVPDVYGIVGTTRVSDEEHKWGWDDNSDLDRKIRVREMKSGWFVYLPDPNAKICFNKKDVTFDEDSYKQKNYDFPDIDVCVFETELFEKLVKTLENICLSIEASADRFIERWMNYEVDVYTGFEKLGEVIGGHYGYFYRPCIVKAKKSGRKEERQDRNAKFHRWADLSKGVQQVVAIVEFDDGHIEQVQPDRVIFKEVEENA